MARRILNRRGCRLAIVLIGSLAQASVTYAGASADCAMINLGRLNVALAPGSSVLRTVDVERGDTLAFTFRANGHAVGSVALVAGGGRERQLFHGPSGTQFLYKVEEPGQAGFRLATRGDEVASFKTTCASAAAPGADLAGDSSSTRDSSGMAAGPGLNIDMSVPLAFEAVASKSDAATPDLVASDPAAGHSVEWLGGQKSDAQVGAGLLGVKLKLKPAILIGLLAQFEQSDDLLLGPRPLSDQSWLAGPVTTVRLGPGLSLDARAAWGPVEPGQSAIDHAADRQLIDARLAGKRVVGSWRFSPSVGLSYLQEKRDAIAPEQPPEAVEHQTVESGRVDIRPEIAYRIDMGHSTFMEPKVMVGAFWNIGDRGAPGAVADAPNAARGMAETGITFGTASGTRLQFGGGVEEGEPRFDDVWKGRVQLNIPLK